MYKASFKGRKNAEISITKETKCVLPISVGWNYHEGDYFQSTIELVNRSFSFCRIVLCDSLQRYSLKFIDSKNPKDNESIKIHANRLGDEWLDRNKKFINKLTIDYCIKRWDDYIETKSYKEELILMEDFIKSNPKIEISLREAAAETYDRFVKAKKLPLNFNNKDDFILNSVNYLIEEIIVTILWKNNKEEVLLYPKNLSQIMLHLLDKFLGKKRKEINPIQIRFKSIK